MTVIPEVPERVNSRVVVVMAAGKMPDVVGLRRRIKEEEHGDDDGEENNNDDGLTSSSSIFIGQMEVVFGGFG